jgi:hypothetical protein
MAAEAGGLPPNAALGATCEDQIRADLNVPPLLAAKAELKPLFAFVSCEPLLGAIDLCHYLIGTGLDLVITGGESGRNARPMHPAWARSLRDQCAAAGVAFFFKQWGEWAPVSQMSEDDHERSYSPRRERDPEASRRALVETTVLHGDGSRHEIAGPGTYLAGSQSMLTFKVGKKAAGRLLDGVEHSAFPEARP